MSQLSEAVRQRLSLKAFDNIDDLLGEGWSLGLMTRGNPDAYLRFALQRVDQIEAQSAA